MTKMLSEIKESAGGVRAAALANAETLKKIVGEIHTKEPKTVVIAARGTSDHAGIFGKYLIETYCGIPVSLSAPSVITAYNGGINMKDCLVIGISQSGKAADVCEVLNRAKRDGGITVAVTNDKTSPMAGIASYHLDCSQSVEVSVAATKTFVSQLYIMLLLTAVWSGSNSLNAAIEKVPVIIEKTYPLEDSLENIAKNYRFIEDSFVLGRGFAFPIAMEFALKTQETCYIRSRAYATSDFYHGPIAMISSNTPVFLFCIEESMRADTLKMLGSVREKGGDVLLFTALDGMEDVGANVVKLPGDSFVEGAFSATVAMQLFACKLSLARGIDPDSPRGLSKVTITR